MALCIYVLYKSLEYSQFYGFFGRNKKEEEEDVPETEKDNENEKESDEHKDNAAENEVPGKIDFGVFK